jgi:predicted Zn finger-like uncharacterized protein
MPEIIACPDCERTLRVPDNLLGRKVKCPSCGITFTAGGDPGGSSRVRKSGISPDRGRRYEEDEPPRSGRRYEEDEPPRSRRRHEDDEDYPRSRRDDDYYDEDYQDSSSKKASRVEGWKKTRLGLNLVLISNYVYIGTCVLAIVGSFLIGAIGFGAMSSARTTGQAVSTAVTLGTGMMIFAGLLMLLGFAVEVLGVTGKGFCMAVPPVRGTGTRPLAIATFCCAATAFGFNMIGMLISLVSYGMAMSSPFAMMGLGLGLNPAIAILSFLATLAGGILWIFFLRSVCVAVRNNELARTLVVFLISAAVYVVVAIGLGCILILVVGASMVSLFGGVASGRTSVGSAQAAANVSGALLIGFWCVIGLVGLGMYIWYLVLLHQVRAVVDRAARRRL